MRANLTNGMSSTAADPVVVPDEEVDDDEYDSEEDEEDEAVGHPHPMCALECSSAWEQPRGDDDELDDEDDEDDEEDDENEATIADLYKVRFRCW